MTSEAIADQDPAASTRTPYFYWEASLAGNDAKAHGRIQGSDLAILRRGVGAQPGAVPQMWPYYRNLTVDGRLTFELQAEHLTLCLFGLHQQSKDRPMHRDGLPLGQAVRALRDSAKTSEEAVDRRFAAAATATSFTELAGHLRGLVAQLRSVSEGGASGQPLDYTQLYQDLTRWQQSARRAAVTRRWGGAYFGRPASDDSDPTDRKARA